MLGGAFLNSQATTTSSATTAACTDAVQYAGRHVLLDLWQPHDLTNQSLLEAALREAVTACGATLLQLDLHVFSHTGGISGVAILAESHLSIHTWPEHDYAALDIFVCDGVDPSPAVAVIRDRLNPVRMEIREVRRGRLPESE